MDLSIVVPVLNEEDNVGELTSRIDAALVDTNVEYEILFVDDGSTDQTVPRLVDLQEFNPRLRVVTVSYTHLRAHETDS